MNEVDIAARLAHVRGAASQVEFARSIGVHKNTWGNYERGKREIGADALRKLAEAGWSPLWILTGEGSERLPAGFTPDAAADTALVVARADPDAEVRRNERISAFRPDDQVRDSGHMADQPAGTSQPVRREDLMMAVQLANEALGNRVLPPDKYAELVTLLYELLEEGLPNAKVLHFARAAAG